MPRPRRWRKASSQERGEARQDVVIPHHRLRRSLERRQTTQTVIHRFWKRRQAPNRREGPPGPTQQVTRAGCPEACPLPAEGPKMTCHGRHPEGVVPVCAVCRPASLKLLASWMLQKA